MKIILSFFLLVLVVVLSGCVQNNQTDICKNTICNTGEKCADGNCVLMGCEEQNGTMCKNTESCPSGKGLVWEGGGVCCSVRCELKQDRCIDNSNCPANQKCINSFCKSNTCEEAGGKVCLDGTKCTINTISASNTDKCCLTSCPDINPCGRSIICGANQKCVGEGTKCILRSCVEQQGDICSDNEICDWNFLDTSDSGKCCPGKCKTRIKTCEKNGGKVCAQDTECSTNTTSTSDTNICCLSTCETKIKTCGELGGKACSAGNFCENNTVYTNDTNECCLSSCSPINTTTINLNGFGGHLNPALNTPNRNTLLYVKGPFDTIKTNLFLKVVDRSGSAIKTVELFNDGKHGDFNPNDYVAGNYFSVENEGFYTFQICSSTNGPCADLPLRDIEDPRLEIRDMKCLELFKNHNNINADRINLVLIGSGYNNFGDFLNVSKKILSFDGNPVNTALVFDKDVKAVVNESYVDFGFFSVEPLKSNKNKFNIWYLSKQIASSLKDFSRKVTDEKGYLSFCNLKYVYPVFIINDQFDSEFDPRDTSLGSRSNADTPNFWGESEVNKTSIRFGLSLNSFPILYGIGGPDGTELFPEYTHVGGYPLLIHESGHALFGLQDEYTETRVSGRHNYNYPNCAGNLTEAKSWWGSEIDKVDPFYYEYKNIKESNNESVQINESDIKIDFVKGGCGLEDGREGAYRPSKNSMMNIYWDAPVFGSVNRKRVEQILELFTGH